MGKYTHTDLEDGDKYWKHSEDFFLDICLGGFLGLELGSYLLRLLSPITNDTKYQSDVLHG